jgi:hypothetical protein
MRETFESEGGSMRGDEDFFSVARTIPFVAIQILARSGMTKGRRPFLAGAPLIPSEVTPWLTAFNAYSTDQQRQKLRPVLRAA